MTFLNPLLLLGLAAAAIPILVHLFNFRRPRRVVFSSLAFLRELEKSTMQRVRVQQWLLLALRILALAFLALAFARPVVEGLGGGALGRSNASVLLLLDNSRSMQFRDAQGAYFDQAKALATGLVEGLEEGDELYLLPMAADPVQRPAAFRSRAALLDAVAALEIENGTRPLGEALDRAAALLESATHPTREIYVVSDFQASLLSDSARTPVPFDGRVVLLPVGGRPQANVSVAGVEVTSRIVEAGQPVSVVATLVNHGREVLSDYGATVTLDGRSVARNTATLPPGVPTSVAFTFTPDARGWLGGEVRIEADVFEDDNARAFALHVPEARQVLVVRGAGAATRYLEIALSPALAAGEGAFRVTALPEAQLAATDLAAFDAVVLAGPSALSSGEAQALARFVEGGGGVLAFPSEATAALNALLAQTGGGTLGAATPPAETPVATFGQVDREHPVFAGVFDAARGQVEQPDLYRYAPYRSGGGAETTLIELAGGQPFLQEIRHGSGAVLLFTTALDRSWTDLPTRGLFVPLLYRGLFYLAASDGVQGEALRAGEPARLQIGGRQDGAALELVAPGGASYVLAQRPLFGSTLLETGEALTEMGVYTLRRGAEVVRRVAVNLDPRESDPAGLSGAEAREKVTAVTGLEPLVVSTGEGRSERVQAALAGASGGREIWNILLWVALLFLAAEMIVARRRPPVQTHS